MYWLLGGLLAALVVAAPLVGLFVQPWAPFWLGQQSVGTLRLDKPSPTGPVVPAPAVTVSGVTDAQRYQLARAAGWSATDALTAVAISIAENGSGNPAALSGANFDGSRDLGLWQINSGWWQSFGGQAALSDPMNNARAAFAIYGRQGWCAWSTYESRCGFGHNGSYAAFLGRARAAAQ